MGFPMSLRWTSFVAPNPYKGGSKMQNGHFPSKIALCLKKVCYKVSLCENCQQHCCIAFIGLSICMKMIGGDVPFYVKIWWILIHPLQNANFQSIFSGSASAVTPSKKSSISTNMTSTVHFPVILRWTSYVAPDPPPKGCLKKAVSKIWTISCDNS